MLVLIEALLKAGHVVEPCSETQDCAAAAGSVAARMATASDVLERRGCVWCLLAGLGRRTLMQRSAEGAQPAMVGGTGGEMGCPWARAQRARLAEGGRPAADVRVHDSMRGSGADGGSRWYIFTKQVQALAACRSGLRATRGRRMGGAGRKRKSDSGVGSCNAGRGGEQEAASGRHAALAAKEEGIAQATARACASHRGRDWPRDRLGNEDDGPKIIDDSRLDATTTRDVSACEPSLLLHTVCATVRRWRVVTVVAVEGAAADASSRGAPQKHKHSNRTGAPLLARSGRGCCAGCASRLAVPGQRLCAAPHARLQLACLFIRHLASR
jgi:hypothetical protein